MKKILFILPAFTYGGTVFSTLNMVSLLDSNEYDIKILAMTHQGPVKSSYPQHFLLPERLLLSALLGKMSKEKKIIKKLFFFLIKVFCKVGGFLGFSIRDLIYEHEARVLEKKYTFDFVASCQEWDSTYFVSHFKKTKKIAWFRSEYQVYHKLLTAKQREYEQKIYPSFYRIVCVSQTTKDDFISFFPAISSNVVAIHNIQNDSNILNMANEKIDDSFDKNTFNIVSIGRFAPQKRFSCIPQIAEKLKQNGLRFMWYIIGDGNMEMEFDKTIENVAKYDVSDCVKCIGSRINPYPYIKQADLLVSTSYYEACPRVVAEARIIHTPIVSADYSSAREFVRDGENGFVGKISELADLIERFIVDENLYSMVKLKCNDYIIDNNVIYNQLKELFA